MKRAALVGVGTLAGLAALIAFNPEAGATSSASSTVAAGTTDTSSATATPSTSTSSGSSSSTSSGSSGTSTSSGTSSTSSPSASATPAASSSSAATSTAASGTFTGDAVDVGRGYGTIQVVVTVANGKVTDVSTTEVPSNDPRSQQISAQAVPMLVQQAISAQSSSISGVSGATFTSNGFVQSLASALAQAGLS